MFQGWPVDASPDDFPVEESTVTRITISGLNVCLFVCLYVRIQTLPLNALESPDTNNVLLN